MSLAISSYIGATELRLKATLLVQPDEARYSTRREPRSR
jgi:hypothetical protein